MTAGQVHNYYHNTWTRKFFADLNPYRQELQDFIAKYLITQEFSATQIANDFQAMHPDVNFNRYQLMQTIHIYNRRIFKSKRRISAQNNDSQDQSFSQLKIDDLFPQETTPHPDFDVSEQIPELYLDYFE